MLINNLNFAGPYYYDRNFDQDFACVYAIVVGNKLIYVGITDSINTRMSGHHKVDCWKRYSSDTKILYFYRESNQATRESIEAGIIKAYNTPCNG